MTEEEQTETYEFIQRLKQATPVEFLEWVKAHRHNGNDFPKVRAADLEGVLGLANGGTGSNLVDPNADRLMFWDDSASAITFLTLGTGLSISGTTINGVEDTNLVAVTGGESLAAGEIVRLQAGTGNNATQGYLWVNNSIYAVRAAANDTTYGGHVYGVVAIAGSYLGSATVRVGGQSTVMSGLTAMSRYYLADYGASSETITQATDNAEQQLSAGVTLSQVFIPTSSRIDKVVLKCRRNGGGGGNVRVKLMRVNTELANATAAPVNGNPAAEFTFDFTDTQVYKGEILRLAIDDDAGGGDNYVAYQNTGNPYAQTGHDGTATSLSGGSVPADISDLYMKVHEFSNFGKVAATAGTRKIKIGQALSATSLAYSLQYGDSIL